jgi:DNA-3-methyladenine glycosylase II
VITVSPDATAPPLPWIETAHHHLLTADTPMVELVRRQGIVTRRVTGDSREYFARLIRAIVGQQISGKAAASIYGRVAGHAGDPPLPEALHALPDEILRACGLSANKLLSIRDLTERTLDRRLDIDHLATLPDEEVREQLVAIRGIGRWTADMFLMFALGRPDVLPADDLGIQNAIQSLYALETRPTPKDVCRLAEEGRWHPFATAASFHLWESLT